MPVKVRTRSADIIDMASTNCAACGSDLADSGARFCSSCGVPIATDSVLVATQATSTSADPAEGEATPAPVAGLSDAPSPEPEVAGEEIVPIADRPLRRTMTEEQWRYTTWGAVAAGAVAIVALVAVVFGLLSRAEDASAASNGRNATTTTTTTTIPVADGPTAAFPITDALTIQSPRIGYPVWYRFGPTAVILTLTMTECDRIDGMLRASGEIRNNSPLGQTLDYRFGVEMNRPVVGTSVASLEATVEGLDAGGSIEWLVETPSTKSVSVRCDIPSLTVAPVADG